MDPLSDVLSLLKPAEFGFRGLDAAGAWAIAFPASAGLKVFAIETGKCWMAIDSHSDPVPLTAGHLVLLPGRTGYRLFSDPTAAAVDADTIFMSFPTGTAGTLNGGGDCSGVGGFFTFTGNHAEILLDVLPPFIHLRAESAQTTLTWLIGRLMAELRTPQPGGALIAGHLAQTLLVEALRLQLDLGGWQGSGWLAALSDRRVRLALDAIHASPGYSWSLAELASACGMSRSNFAERFCRLMGEPPLAYLTRWRMMLAADRLTRSGASLADVAESLGYSSESALGVAFKRVTGRSPRRFVASTRSSTSTDPDARNKSADAET